MKIEFPEENITSLIISLLTRPDGQQILRKEINKHLNKPSVDPNCWLTANQAIKMGLISREKWNEMLLHVPFYRTGDGKTSSVKVRYREIINYQEQYMLSKKK